MKYLVMTPYQIYSVETEDNSGKIIAIQPVTDSFFHNYIYVPVAEAKLQWRMAHYTYEEDQSVR